MIRVARVEGLRLEAFLTRLSFADIYISVCVNVCIYIYRCRRGVRPSKNRILLGEMEPLFLGKETCSTGYGIRDAACDLFLISACGCGAVRVELCALIEVTAGYMREKFDLSRV